jgi:hypothetical protein
MLLLKTALVTAENIKPAAPGQSLLLVGKNLPGTNVDREKQALKVRA